MFLVQRYCFMRVCEKTLTIRVWCRLLCSRSLGKSVCRVWCRLHYSRNHCKPCHRGWYRLRCSRSHHILYRPGWYRLRCSRSLGRLGCPERCKPHRSRNLCKCVYWRKILLREQRRSAHKRRGTAGRKVCTGVSSYHSPSTADLIVFCANSNVLITFDNSSTLITFMDLVVCDLV